LVAQPRRLGYCAGKRAAMSYVQHVLQPGEEIRHTARIHWIKYMSGLLLLSAAVVMVIFGELAERARIIWLIIAAATALIALGQLLHAWFVRWTTEIAVTNRRVIRKMGFIRRDTVEMHMDKVESVDVDQSVLGRLLDYGTVIVRGTGTGLEPLRNVAKPLELRNHITGI
jgi:uncharacterized membrane protein YdbT with pleckstrin-like domain